VTFGGTSWITSQYPTLPAWDLPFERSIPFIPEACLLYSTLTPVLLFSTYFFRTRAEMAPFAIALSVQAVVASLFFLLFPQTVAWTRPEVTGWLQLPFSLVDAMNLSYNQFPSLHVALAFSVAFAYPRWRALWWSWAVAVTLSTWFLWEHHLIDIAGGIALAAIAMPLLYPRVHVELQCLWQCARFSRRHVRYFVIFLAIYVPSLLRWRRYRAVRTGFCAAQWIDDLLDGDRPSRREPLEIIDELIEQMIAGMFAADALSQLVAVFFRDIDERARDEFIALVRCMRVDRLRVLGRQRWTRLELEAHHEMTFRHSVNLMLVAAGCTARASAVPSLVRALGWCSIVRDLDEDLRKGLNNIPRDVDAAQWTAESHARACTDLEAAAQEISKLDDVRARRILGIFRRSVAKYARRGMKIPRDIVSSVVTP
jgi:membrane-associated phospholipid phosphatase